MFSPTGYVAIFANEFGHDDRHAQVRKPVVRFDEDGDAVVCNERGALVVASMQPRFRRVEALED